MKTIAAAFVAFTLVAVAARADDDAANASTRYWAWSSITGRADGDSWTLTTADFKTQAVTPTGIDGNGITVTAGDGSKQTVPLASFVQLTGPAQRKPVSGLVLCVAGGERLVGSPLKMDGQALVWFTGGVGEVRVPLDSVLGVLRDHTTADELNAVRTEDTAKLSTGDTVAGILTDAGSDAFTITPATGDAVKVAPAAVASILFASPPAGRKAQAVPAYLVRVTGGSVLACDQLATTADKRLTLTSASGTAAVPLAQVESIEHTGGPVAWLSQREPTENVYTPYLDGHYPARMDAAVTGGPIRFGGVTYARGIGVHSRSKLVFAVQPGDKSFRTRYAIDPAASRADVDVCISVDDKVVHEQKGFKAGTLSPLIEADVSAAKTITLEVDYGQGYDVQDRLNWIEPAILRQQ